jgi:hypothetical protein
MRFPSLAAELESLELDALNSRTKESVEAADDRPHYHGDLCRPWRQVKGGARRVEPSTHETRFYFITCPQECTSCRTMQIVATSCRRPLDPA